MKSYNQKQYESGLNRGDYIKPKRRPYLISHIYFGRYAEYSPDMDRYANRHQYPIQQIRCEVDYGKGIVLAIGSEVWAYPYFLVDKQEIYNPEEDI